MGASTKPKAGKKSTTPAAKTNEKQRARHNRTERAAAPRFTFIVPAYVTEKNIGSVIALGRCMDSIIAQTDTSWEIILVHDGPSPLCRAFAEGLRKDLEAIGKEGHFRYVEAPYVGARGGHQSINVALEHVRGEFVAFVNGDNTIREHYVASMYDADADIVCGSVRMNDMPGHTLNGRGWHRGGIDRLNYAIRSGIAREVRHKMHLDADYDYLIDCWNHRDAVAPVRVRYVEQVVAEHN